uniref:Protein kinase domain-containing protein n=1 Tax=Parastrongyloides trichosuri TaxID=131310 RepID=A0A0N4ZQC4_PARTI
MVFNKRTLSITSKYSTLDDDEYGDMPYSKRLLSDISRKLPITSNLRIVDFNETFSEIKQLGIGRFGPVKQYLNKNNNKFVVGKHVKMEMFDHMYQDWGKIKKRINDFLKELEILYNLSRKHDRIADFLGIYNDNEKLIIFTEYLCNGSVKDKLEDGVGLSEKLTLKYFYQVCEGLHWLHDRSSPVVHRDIKAANILITAYDDVKLANFGLVRDLAIDGFGVSVGSEVSFDFRGTMLYVAPEVITSELGPGNKNAYGKPADMWALGCTIIEMLVCHPPYFEYFGCVEEMQKEVRERANGPIDKQLPYESKVLCPTASKHIKFLVDKLFEKNPDYRITVGQLIKLKRKMDETIESNYIDINAIYEKLKLNDSTGTLFSSDINSTRSSIEISALKDCNNTVKTLHKEEEVKGIKIGSSFNSTTKKQKKSNTIKDSAICFMYLNIFIVLIFLFIFYCNCDDIKGPLTKDFQSWLNSNGYKEYDFVREEFGFYGSYGGKKSSNASITKKPIIFIHGNSDGALKMEGLYSTGFSKTIEYFQNKGYGSEELYVTTWGDRNSDNAGKRSHSCEYVKYIRSFIDAVMKYTKSETINVISHSMGVTMARKAIVGTMTTDILDNCLVGRPLGEKVNVFIGLAGANYGLCTCSGPFASVEYTCNNLNGFFPGNDCESYLLYNKTYLPNDKTACDWSSENMICLKEPKYSKVLYDLNHSKYNAGQNIYSFWSLNDEVLGKTNEVWGRPTSHIPKSDGVRIFLNLSHEQVKDNTIPEQYSIINRFED